MTPEEEQQKKNQEEIDQILNKDSKKFVDSARLYIAKDYFALRLNVGVQPETFVFTPYLAKMMGHIFAKQIEGYESQFGLIPTGLSIPSFLQQTDLQQPPESGESSPPSSGPQTPDKPKGKK